MKALDAWTGYWNKQFGHSDSRDEWYPPALVHFILYVANRNREWAIEWEDHITKLLVSDPGETEKMETAVNEVLDMLPEDLIDKLG